MKPASQSPCRTIFFVLTAFFTCFPQVVQSIEIPQKKVEQDSLRRQIRELKLQMTKNNRDTKVLNQLCNIYFQLDDIDSAEFWINLSRQVEEDDPETRFWRGRIFLSKGNLSIIPMERLMELIKQDNHSRAIREFDKATILSPDYLEAYYYLGKAYIAKGGDSNYEKAVRTYNTIVEKNLQFQDIYYQMAIAYQKLKKPEESIKYLNLHSGRSPGDARPFIKMSDIHMEMGKTESASRLFLQGVVRLRDAEMLDNLFTEVKDIAEREEKEEFESTSLDRKGLFFQKFWKRRDPTPFTEENERYTEHFRRVAHARNVFSFPTVFPYYDDRGRIYVKYGEPDTRYVSTMFGNNVKQNESWSYEISIKRGLVFDFVQFGAYYEMVEDLREAGRAGSDYYDRVLVAGQLYNQRAADLGGLYNKFAVSFEERDVMDFTNEKTAAEKSAPAEVFRHDYEASHLPIQIRYAQFRGEAGTTRLEVYHSVLGSKLGSSQPKEKEYVASVNSVVGLFDSYYTEIDKKERETQLVGASEQQIDDIASIDETVFPIMPGDRYRIVVKVENPEGNLLGISNFDVNVKDFAGDSLQISDLELASRVEQAQKRGRFYKHGLWVLPYTFQGLDRIAPATLYYEIYNLTRNLEGQTNYTLDYKVTTLRRKEGGIKKVFRSIGKLFGSKEQSVTASYERQGTSSDEKEYISLNIQKMPAGTVELSVTVTDHLSKQTRTSSLNLEII